MRIDLHTHSDRSDGTDTPAELVRHARDQGVDVLALTDHDTKVALASRSPPPTQPKSVTAHPGVSGQGSRLGIPTARTRYSANAS